MNSGRINPFDLGRKKERGATILIISSRPCTVHLDVCMYASQFDEWSLASFANFGSRCGKTLTILTHFLRHILENNSCCCCLKIQFERGSKIKASIQSSVTNTHNDAHITFVDNLAAGTPPHRIRHTPVEERLVA